MQIVSEIEIAVLTAGSASSCKRNCKMNCSSCCCYRGKYYGNYNSSCTSNSDVVMEIGRGGCPFKVGGGGRAFPKWPRQDKEKLCCFNGPHNCHIPGGSLSELSMRIKKESTGSGMALGSLGPRTGIS